MIYYVTELEGHKIAGLYKFGPVVRAYKEHVGSENKTNIGMLVSYIPGDHVFLDKLHVLPVFRDQGIASMMMRYFLHHCDAFYPDLQIRVYPEPFDDKPLNKQQLSEFYRKFGFKWCSFDRSNYMERGG